MTKKLLSICSLSLVFGTFLCGCHQNAQALSSYQALDTLDVSIGYWNFDDMSVVQKDDMRDYVE